MLTLILSLFYFRKKRKQIIIDKWIIFFNFNSLNIIFCDDTYLLSINNQFLKHDFYTDIITFDLGSKKSDPIQGEIYISTERVKDNASKLGTPFIQELHRVVFHGLLHLLGYRDKLKKDQLTMRSMEDKLLMLYFGAKKKSISK